MKNNCKKDILLNKIIGQKIRDIRKSKKLTLEQVSKFLEITPQQLQKYEVNATQIPFSKLYLFLQALEVKPESFFNIEIK